MANVTVVEPNTLLRLGILRLLQTLDCALVTTGIDYAQLFQGNPQHAGTDLMMLSVPSKYDRTIELVSAAQHGYSPSRILLLSDTRTLPYSLLNLPPVLAGYISKYSSQDVLKTSVMLVLAGGKCFPHPDLIHQSDAGDSARPPDGDAPPKRRWYDKQDATCSARDDEPQPDNLLHLPEAEHSPPRPPQTEPRHTPTLLEAAKNQALALTPDLISREADLLHLTPRQYEVLALLAKGYPLKKISRELNISVATAKTHSEALYQRLAVNNRNAAVYAAVSRGATLGWHEPIAAAPSQSCST